MIDIEHVDELTYAGTGGGSNRHAPKLLLQTPEAAMYLFAGANIPGVCKVLKDTYNKNGKWSFSTWQIRLADGVKAWTNKGGILSDISGLYNLKINYIEARDWAEIPEEIRPVVRAFLPKTTARLDENAKPVLERE